MDYHVFTRNTGKEVPAMTAEEALCYIHSAYRKLGEKVGDAFRDGGKLK